MSARTQTQRIVTLLLVLAFLVCSVPMFAVPASAADSETYLYNGVELPALPGDYDYSYKTIFSTASGYYLFQASNYGYHIDAFVIKASAWYVCYKLTDGAWKLDDGPTRLTVGSQWAYYTMYPVWVNYDYCDEDGSILVVGSEPVTVVNSSVTSLEISCADWVGAGQWIPITGTVSGNGEYSTECTCTVSGGTSSGTYVTVTEQDDVFNLHVGEDETADNLTVTVTSVQDPSISASKTINVVYVDTGGSDGEDTTPTESTPDDIEGTEPATEDEQGAAADQGNSSIDELTGVIPDYSEGFMDALSSFTSAMTYTGTDAKLTIPAVAFPALGSLVPGFQMMDETVVDFGEYVAMMPQNLMLLVQSLLTIALIVYCFKELYGTISYVLTLKGGNG